MTFELNTDGLLTVTAKDKTTGQEQELTIDDKEQLTKEQMKKMVDEAGRYRVQDEQQLEQIKAKNEFETTLHNLRQLYNNKQNQMNDNEKTALNNCLIQNDQWLNANQSAPTQDYKDRNQQMNEVYNPIKAAYP